MRQRKKSIGLQRGVIVGFHTRLIRFQTSPVVNGVQMVRIPDLVVLTSDLGRMANYYTQALVCDLHSSICSPIWFFIHLHLVYEPDSNMSPFLTPSLYARFYLAFRHISNQAASPSHYDILFLSQPILSVCERC